jgi:hypothetical protein
MEIMQRNLKHSDKLCVRRQWTEYSVGLGEYAEVAATARNRNSVAQSVARTSLYQSSS